MVWELAHSHWTETLLSASRAIPTPLRCVIINTLAGFFLIVHIVVPAAYWSNTYDAKKFPFHATKTFDATGPIYNISCVLNEETFDFNEAGYNSYSKIYLSVFLAMSYGISFATLADTISHVALCYSGYVNFLNPFPHPRLMKKNYKPVPNWRFHPILIVVFVLSLLACEGFDKQLQLPCWGLILACAIAWFFTLPIGLIQATTNQVEIIEKLSDTTIALFAQWI